MASALSGSKKITASQASAPFLVAPSDSASTPARQVSAAGAAPVAASALAKRAPSICTPIPASCAIAAKCGDLVGPVERPRLRRLAERQRAGLAAS